MLMLKNKNFKSRWCLRASTPVFCIKKLNKAPNDNNSSSNTNFSVEENHKGTTNPMSNYSHKSKHIKGASQIVHLRQTRRHSSTKLHAGYHQSTASNLPQKNTDANYQHSPIIRRQAPNVPHQKGFIYLRFNRTRERWRQPRRL